MPQAMAIWRTPTESDLAASLSASEIEAYRSAAADPDIHGDPITALIERGIAYVRGYLRANPAIVLGPAGTLPASLIAPCMDYIGYDVVKRVPRANTEDRRAARKDAIALFTRVQSGHYHVESYQSQESQGTTTAVELVTPPNRRVTPHTLQGL